MRLLHPSCFFKALFLNHCYIAHISAWWLEASFVQDFTSPGETVMQIESPLKSFAYSMGLKLGEIKGLWYEDFMQAINDLARWSEGDNGSLVVLFTFSHGFCFSLLLKKTCITSCSFVLGFRNSMTLKALHAILNSDCVCHSQQRLCGVCARTRVERGWITVVKMQTLRGWGKLLLTFSWA